MAQHLSVITLGVADLTISLRFYVEGFRWKPIFKNDEIIFYQMNGFVLGTWLKEALIADTGILAVDETAPASTARTAAAANFALAHNVAAQSDVAPLIDRLASFGGTVLRPGDAPPHGGFRGYVSDPDGHIWEIAWNPAWTIDEAGHVTFGV